jgi:hypothetical protein
MTRVKGGNRNPMKENTMNDLEKTEAAARTPEVKALDAVANAALVALSAHHAECCKATAKHPLDDADLCDKGKGLYREFMKANAAHADALARAVFGDQAILTDPVTGRPMGEAAVEQDAEAVLDDAVAAKIAADEADERARLEAVDAEEADRETEADAEADAVARAEAEVEQVAVAFVAAGER